MSFLQQLLGAGQAAGNIIQGRPANYGHEPQDIAAARGEAMLAAARSTPRGSSTKVPFKNGMYAGPYNPAYQGPEMQMRQQPGYQVAGIPLLNQMANLGAPSTQDLQQGLQGGTQNIGFTPLQNSGFGPGGNPQSGAFNRLQSANHRNPQVSDTGFYWY